MKKLYIHLQDTADASAATTKVVKPDQQQTLLDCARAAFPSLHTASSTSLTAYLLINEQRRKPLALSMEAVRLDQGADVFLEHQQCDSNSVPSACKQSLGSGPAAELPSSADIAGQESSSRRAGPASSNITTRAPPPTASPSPQLGAAIDPLLSCAATAVVASNLQLAVELYEKALSLCPDHLGAVKALGLLWLKHAQQPMRALPHLQHLAEEEPLKSSDGCQAQKLLADCLLALGRASEAFKVYQKALLAAVENAAPLAKQLELQISMAWVMRKLDDQPGLKDVASTVVMNVLDADPTNFGALELYAHIAEEQGLHEDALRVALRLIVAQQQHKGVRALLARRLQAPGGIKALFEELSIEGKADQEIRSQSGPKPSKAGSASALAFLATVVKENGAVGPTIQLLQKALELDPLHPSYALNLAHAHELTHDMRGVAATVQGFLERVAGACEKAQHLALGGGLCYQDVASLLQGLSHIDPKDPSTWLAWRTAEPWNPADHTVKQDGGNIRKVEYSSDQLDMLALCFTAVKALYIGGAVARTARLVALLEPARLASHHELHKTLIRNEAAYYNCTLQLLQDKPPPAYGSATRTQSECTTHAQSVSQQLEELHMDVQGSTGPVTHSGSTYAAAPGAAASIVLEPPKGVTSERGSMERDPLRLDPLKGDTEGHHQQEPLPVQGPNAPQPLYFCGDSHCLPAAWRVVRLQGRLRMLQPLLVTGCKIWHLRPDSTFYPKVQFQNALAHLPDQSQIIMLLGEIDCREGLLMAVHKCKYSSVEEALTAAVDLYLSVLLDQIKHRGFELFVHPIPPVLNETRPVVKAFMHLLKSKVTGAAVQEAAKGRLHYLNFFEALLDAEGSALAPGLELDGTHLSPDYLSLLRG